MLIKETDWYKLYKHELETNTLLSKVRDFMRHNKPMSLPGKFNKGHNTWTFVCKDTYNYVNSLHSVRPLTSTTFVGEMDHAFTIWEMNTGSNLPPHIDASHNTAFVILPLIGRTRTSMHGTINESIDNNHKTPVFDSNMKTLDSVTYGTGEMIVVNNTQFIHSVKPLDHYRLVLQFNARKF